MSTVNELVKSLEAPLTPEAIVELLRTIRQQIPEYSQLTLAEAAAKRSAARVDPHFVDASIHATDASPSVQGALKRTPDSLRTEVADSVRWEVVENEMKATLQGVSAANLIRRHRIGVVALQTYTISRQLVRTPDHQDLLPHVQEMKRLNRFGRPRRPGAAQPKPQTDSLQPQASTKPQP
jgi:hypothetical protein